MWKTSSTPFRAPSEFTLEITWLYSIWLIKLPSSNRSKPGFSPHNETNHILHKEKTCHCCSIPVNQYSKWPCITHTSLSRVSFYCKALQPNSQSHFRASELHWVISFRITLAITPKGKASVRRHKDIFLSCVLLCRWSHNQVPSIWVLQTEVNICTAIHTKIHLSNSDGITSRWILSCP